METLNFFLYVVFSIVNFTGCIYAIFKMYAYFRPEQHIPKYFRAAIHGWICTLIIFAVQQLNVLILGDIGLAWSIKLGVFIFVFVSINFGKLADHLKDTIET